MQKRLSLFLLFFVVNSNVFAMDEGNRPPVPEERHDQGLSQHDLDMFAGNLATYMYDQGYHNETVDAQRFWQIVAEFENEMLNVNEKEAIIRHFAAYTPEQAEIFQRHVMRLLGERHDHIINGVMNAMQHIMPELVAQMSYNGQLANFRLNFNNLRETILRYFEALFPEIPAGREQDAREKTRQFFDSLNEDQQNMLLQAFAQARNAYIPKVPGARHVSPNRLARAVKIARELANVAIPEDFRGFGDNSELSGMLSRTVEVGRVLEDASYPKRGDF